MKKEEFIEIFEGDSGNWTGDNAFQGLQIIAKYIDPKEKELICGAGHDEIWSVDIDELLDAGINTEDAKKLRELNWGLEAESYLRCFV